MRGIIFLIDFMFALALAAMFIYLISDMHTNQIKVATFNDMFAQDVVTVYSSCNNLSIIKQMFEDKGYSGSFDDNIFGSCDNANVYVKHVGHHTISYCKSKVVKRQVANSQPTGS